MNKICIFIIIFFLPGICVAADSINIPWEEFKIMYKERIEKKILDKLAQAPFVYSIESASYKIKLTREGGTGKMMITGTAISGDPQFITLFNDFKSDSL